MNAHIYYGGLSGFRTMIKDIDDLYLQNPPNSITKRIKQYSSIKCDAVEREYQTLGMEELNFLFGGNEQKVGIKFTEGKLIRIPWFVKDIEGKKTKLRNTGIHSTVGKTTFLLYPYDKIPVILPGGIFR